MKKITHIFLLIFSITLLTSCVDDETGLELFEESVNVVTFDRVNDNLVGVTVDGGAEYTFLKKIRVEGPTVSELTNDIIVDAIIAEGTTADNTMYRINNLPLTLTKENNYLGYLSITMTTLGNEPPADGTPEAEAYVAPVLKLQLVATGDENVVGSGKIGVFTLNFALPNPMAGDYTAHLIYRHPNAGTYPDNIYVEEDNDKSLLGITGVKAESDWFATWEGYYSWITLNSDNTVTYTVDSDWDYDVKMGDPNRPDLISHYDPETGIIYLYYHYTGSGGDRIFWEVWYPKS